MPKLALVGAQFGDPVLFGSWLARRYGFKLSIVSLSETERALIGKATIADREWQVHVLVRACWDAELSHRLALQDADHVLVALCRLERTKHLNADAIDCVRRHVRASARLVAVFNDSRCEAPDMPDADSSLLRSQAPADWSVHFTRCGDFGKHFEADKCEEGVEAAFRELLE